MGIRDRQMEKGQMCHPSMKSLENCRLVFWHGNLGLISLTKDIIDQSRWEDEWTFTVLLFHVLICTYLCVCVCVFILRSCLQLITDCPPSVQDELDLISALSRLEDFGVKVLPLQGIVFLSLTVSLFLCLSLSTSLYVELHMILLRYQCQCVTVSVCNSITSRQW